MANCTYHPYISPGNSDITPPSSTTPVLVERDTIELAYPYASPTTTLELRNPEVNDINTLNQIRLIKRSRGNRLITFRESSWAEYETLAFAFSVLTRDTARELLDFFLESLGKEIKLTDYLSREWQGIILNPTEAINERGACKYSAQFLFEGVEV